MIPLSAPRRFLLSLALLCLALSTSSSLRAADEVKFPADGSGIRFTPPVGWKISPEVDGIINCTSPDGIFSFSFIPFKDIRDMKNELVLVARTLGDKIKLTDTTGGHSSEGESHDGLKLFLYTFKGKIDGQDCALTTVGLVPEKGIKCVLFCVTPQNGQEAHNKEMRAVMHSLKPAAD
ncbi:MAG: hypothetical protein H0X40_11365 [Chthoniobacterales bacterium]|nr:hypothetical protein [Chthoniobacterales bacterium]